jgi:hypothetical protein
MTPLPDVDCWCAVKGSHRGMDCNRGKIKRCTHVDYPEGCPDFEPIPEEVKAMRSWAEEYNP